MYISVKYSAVEYSAVKYSATEYSILFYSAVHFTSYIYGRVSVLTTRHFLVSHTWNAGYIEENIMANGHPARFCS